MAVAEIMNYVSQAGGLVAIGFLVRGIVAYFLEPKGARARTKLARQTGDVDNLTKLLQLTPGEVVRLQEDLAESESRARTLRIQLDAAHDEVQSLRAALSQMNIQLSRALGEIAELRKRGDQPNDSR